MQTSKCDIHKADKHSPAKAPHSSTCTTQAVNNVSVIELTLSMAVLENIIIY